MIGGVATHEQERPARQALGETRLISQFHVGVVIFWPSRLRGATRLFLPQMLHPELSIPGEPSMLPPLFSSRADGWDDFILEHHRQPAFELPPQTFLMYSISVKLDGPSNIEVKLGGKTYRQRFARGDVCIAPYRFTIEGARAEACEFIQVYLRPSVVEQAATGDHADRVEIVPCLGVVDPLAAQTIGSLLEELTSAARASRLYIDALIKALALHLIRYYSATVRNGRGNVGGLPNYLLTRAQDYVNGSLDRRLSRAEVAQVLGIDPLRLAHAFRATTGKGLRQYRNECRVEKAKLLLGEKKLSLEEVGRRVGLNNAGRFSAIFQKLTGLSPQAYRQKPQN